jgi:glycosyltransferase involved in cell wall biosynthesis
MRILQVMEATLGGTRRYLEDLADALGDGEENGLVYSLHRADTGFMPLLERLRAARWRLFELDMQREIAPATDLRCALALRGIYRRFAPDVIHAHSSKAGALARIATLGMRRRPGIVYTPHSIAANVSAVYGLIEKVLALRLDVLTAVTESERDELLGLHLVPSDRVRVAVPTVSSVRFAPRSRAAARRDLGLGEGPLMVGVGRLTAQKDPLAFVDIAGALRARRAAFRAVWVGDGELREAVEARISAGGLGACVSVTGWLDDVRPYVAAADLILSTSRYESFGYVTAEALTMERPVVATRVTGTVDVMNADLRDHLFSPGDLAGAAARAGCVLDDPRLGVEIAQRGRAYVNRTFSLDATRRGLLAAYGAARQRAQAQ